MTDSSIEQLNSPSDELVLRLEAVHGQARSVMPPDLLCIVDKLKVGSSLLHALGNLESAA